MSTLLPSSVWPLPICLDSLTWHSRFLCNIALYSIGPCFYHQSPPSLHSFWSYFSTDLQLHIGHLLTCGVPLSVSYHFAFSYHVKAQQLGGTMQKLGWVELYHARGHEWWQTVQGCDGAGAAERSYIGTWNGSSKNQGKLEVVKQEMVKVNIYTLGISKLRWTGMGEFNSDDHYIYYCGQEYIEEME